MVRETTYVVQAFNAGKGGNLKAESPIVCKSESGALRTAERLALSKLGVVAFSSSGDAEMGDYDDEPTVFFRKGELPSGSRLSHRLRLGSYRQGRTDEPAT
ncbi:hypothetical protein ACU4GH_36330 [Bradyrhizobium betae]